MGDKTMNPLRQSEHPHQSPERGDDAAPKVDAGDSGATVGDDVDVEAIQEAQAEQLGNEDGYMGFNPDPHPNTFYAQPDPGLHNGEDGGEDEDEDPNHPGETAPAQEY